MRWRTRRVGAMLALWLVATAAGSGLAQGPSPTGSLLGPSPCAEDLADEAFERCVRDALDAAAVLAEGMPTDLRIEPPGPYRGGQRTDDWVAYFEDTAGILSGHWDLMFARGDVVGRGGAAFVEPGAAVLGEGAEPLTMACVTADRSAREVMTPRSGPAYCSVGGETPRGPVTDRGVVYIGVPWFLQVFGEDSAAPASTAAFDDFDFALVAIVAHEMGHHVQHVLTRVDSTGVRKLSETWWELGADCLTGVFARSASLGADDAGEADARDVLEGRTFLWLLGAESAYDTSRDVHGSREQRAEAFQIGFDSGSASQCLRTRWPERADEQPTVDEDG